MHIVAARNEVNLTLGLDPDQICDTIRAKDLKKNYLNSQLNRSRVDSAES